MIEKINGRTPEEIKIKLECWDRFTTQKCKDGKYSIAEQIEECTRCSLFLPEYSIIQATKDVLELIKRMEPVRCKDCAKRAVPGRCPMLLEVDEDANTCFSETYYIDNTQDDGYCHLAERKVT